MCGVTGRSAADISLPEKQHVLCQTTHIRSCDVSVGIYRLFCGMKSSNVASAYLELIHSMLNSDVIWAPHSMLAGRSSFHI